MSTTLTHPEFVSIITTVLSAKTGKTITFVPPVRDYNDVETIGNPELVDLCSSYGLYVDHAGHVPPCFCSYSPFANMEISQNTWISDLEHLISVLNFINQGR